MTVYDLNRDQLTELKQRYYAELTGRDLSYEELANIDFYITDYDVQREFEGVDFVVDDFFASAGQDAWWVKLGIDGELNGTRDGIADDLCQIAEWIRQGNKGGFFYKGISWKITE